MSRRVKNIKLVINGKTIVSNKQKKIYNTVKYASLVKKSESSEQKKEKILQKNLKQKYNLCKTNLFLYSFFILFIIFITYILFSYMEKSELEKIVFIYNKYKLGERIKYKDNYWYVINNSSSDTDILVLLYSSKYDYNGDKVIDKKDKVKYNIDDINKTIRKEYKNSRILTSKEYIEIRDNMSFGYFWDKDNFLAGKNMYDWWVETNDISKLYSITESGCFKENKKDDTNFIRPVVEISKLDYKKS